MKEHFKKYYGLNSQEKRSQAAIPINDEEAIKLLKEKTETEHEGLILGTYGGVDCAKGEGYEREKIN